MVWPTTKRFGCGVASNDRTDYLVCRYYPSGNVFGSQLHPAPRPLASRMQPPDRRPL
jgi:hypothetical protein